MLSRRHLLLSAGAASLAGCATAPAEPTPVAGLQPPPAPRAEAAAELDGLLKAIFEETLDASPQTVTQTGLDKDARAAAKRRLDGASAEDRAADAAALDSQLARLKAIDPSGLSGTARVNYDSMAFLTESRRRLLAFPYGRAGRREIASPYVLSQLTGSYQAVPDFLGTQHQIETQADAEAYLSRLSDFAKVMDGERERAEGDVAQGVIPPAFVVDRAITQMRGLVGPAAASPLVTSLATRAKAKGLTGDYAGQAARIYETEVLPALQRQIAFMQGLRPRAVHDAGAWRLPEGEAYFAAALRNSTTTDLSPDEIHQMGLDQARELSARAETILRGQGLTRGSVGERIQALFKDKRHHYPNTDAGKEKLIADLNVIRAEMSKRLPEVLGALPKAPVEVRRVPKFIEAGAPGGYYNQPSLDGTRPGIFWINLRDTAENPRWTLPTLTYHEAVPGHHNQIALMQEADLPMIRRITFLSAYGEGWALYAEQLALEMGVYKDDPLGELGQIQASLFRAARLVVDTGLHHKRWSREQAIKTMSSIDGSPETSATTEIERYCVWPGQACSYMVGKLTWLRLRDRARAALGPRFDIRRFHDAGLLIGAVPLTVLEAAIDSHIAVQKA